MTLNGQFRQATNHVNKTFQLHFPAGQ